MRMFYEICPVEFSHISWNYNILAHHLAEYGLALVPQHQCRGKGFTFSSSPFFQVCCRTLNGSR